MLCQTQQDKPIYSAQFAIAALYGPCESRAKPIPRRAPRLIPVQVNVLHADRFHALKEKHGREGAAVDRVGDVPLIVFDADRS